jgi:hypothetical protein
MSDVINLTERIKKECADGYGIAQKNNIQPFSGSPEESSLLHSSCLPYKQPLSWMFKALNPSIPKPLKNLMEDPYNYELGQRETVNADGTHTIEYVNNELYLLHYPIDINKIIAQVRYDVTRLGFNINYPEITKTGPDQFLQNLKERFNGGSCIYHEFTGTGRRVDTNIPLIIGKKDMNREIMEFLKEDQNNFFALFYGLTAKSEIKSVKFIEQNTNNIHIYDALNNPKEVHFSIK